MRSSQLSQHGFQNIVGLVARSDSNGFSAFRYLLESMLTIGTGVFSIAPFLNAIETKGVTTAVDTGQFRWLGGSHTNRTASLCASLLFLWTAARRRRSLLFLQADTAARTGKRRRRGFGKTKSFKRRWRERERRSTTSRQWRRTQLTARHGNGIIP